jgi:hypothetical protein
VDVGSFSDVVIEVQKEAVSAATTVAPVATAETVVPQYAHHQEEVSPEFAKELELTIPRDMIPSKMLSCLKFVKISLKAKIPLLPWLLLTRVLVRPTVANY